MRIAIALEVEVPDEWNPDAVELDDVIDLCYVSDDAEDGRVDVECVITRLEIYPDPYNLFTDGVVQREKGKG